MTSKRGIRKRGESYIVDVTVSGERMTATCSTMTEAVNRRAEMQIELLTGMSFKRPQRSSSMDTWTLQKALDKTLSLHKPEGWRGASYEQQATLNAQDALNYMGPHRKVCHVTLELVDAWLNSCEEKGNTNSTINRKLSALSKILKVAVRYGGLDVMPQLPRQREERVGRLRFLSLEEEAKMCGYWHTLGQLDMVSFVTVLIETGMRRSELMNLRPVDVDFDGGVITVYGKDGKGTKNGRIRSVPMTEACREALLTYTSGPHCFSLTESEIRQLWDKGRDHLGLTEDKDFVLHACRHTCASRLVKAGVSLPVVREWMGHSNISTTMRYAHLFPQDLMNAAKLLERN